MITWSRGWFSPRIHKWLTYALLATSLVYIPAFISAPKAHAGTNPLTVSQTLTNDVINQDTSYWPVGARVCNTSGTYSYAITASFEWTSSGNGISLVGEPTQSLGALATNSCKDVYFQIYVPLASNSSIAAGQSQTRKYVITFTTGATATADNNGAAWSVKSSSNRQIYIEPSVQTTNNLHVISMTSDAPISGTTATVKVGSIYTFTIVAETGNGAGWSQIQAYFDPSMFQIVSASSTYGAGDGGAMNGIYNDRCTYGLDFTISSSYTKCANNTNMSATPTMVYKVLVISDGNQTSFPTNISSMYTSGSQVKFQGVQGASITSIKAYYPLTINVSGRGSISSTLDAATGSLATGSTTPTISNCAGTSICTASALYTTKYSL